MPDSTLNSLEHSATGVKPASGPGWHPLIGWLVYGKLSRSRPASLGRGLLKFGLKSVAWAVDSDNLSMVKQAIEMALAAGTSLSSLPHSSIGR
jgi:hypothetical protein